VSDFSCDVTTAETFATAEAFTNALVAGLIVVFNDDDDDGDEDKGDEEEEKEDDDVEEEAGDANLAETLDMFWSGLVFESTRGLRLRPRPRRFRKAGKMPPREAGVAIVAVPVVVDDINDDRGADGGVGLFVLKRGSLRLDVVFCSGADASCDIS
jgi:hypothetical protein